MKFVTVSALLIQVSLAAAADYEKDIKALFKERCVSCHGSVKQKGSLRLDAGALIAKGGKHPVIVSGDSKRSALMERVLSHDEDERMPPEGKRLTAGQIELLRQWIDAGAAYPKNEAIPKMPSEHWSFQAVKRPPVPETMHAHPIDAFIFGKRDPAPRAASQALLRRLYLDLTGLPPTLAEQD